MSFLDTKAPLLLLHRDIVSLPDIPRYDIMLSPQFYVMKREDLPVKYPFQAKKLAPSILDELTGEGEFSYEAFQEDDGWVFVGYDHKKLADFIEGKGGSIDRVRRIYFAEQVKDKFVPPVELNDREALTLINDTVTIVPKRLLENVEHFATFDTMFRPDRSFGVQRTHHSSALDTKLAIALASLFAVFGLAYVAEGYRYHRETALAEEKLDRLLDDNPSLRGAYARESIYKKYTATNTEQRAVRDRIESISHLVGKETKLNSLLIDAKGYRAVLDIKANSKTKKSLKEIAQKGNFAHFKIGTDKLELWGDLK